MAYFKKSNKLRLKELDDYKELFGKKDEKSHFIKEEQSVLRLNTVGTISSIFT